MDLAITQHTRRVSAIIKSLLLSIIEVDLGRDTDASSTSAAQLWMTKVEFELRKPLLPRDALKDFVTKGSVEITAEEIAIAIDKGIGKISERNKRRRT